MRQFLKEQDGQEIALAARSFTYDRASISLPGMYMQLCIIHQKFKVIVMGHWNVVVISIMVRMKVDDDNRIN